MTTAYTLEKYASILAASVITSDDKIIIDKTVLESILRKDTIQELPKRPKKPATIRTLWINDNKETINELQIEGRFLTKASILWKDVTPDEKEKYMEHVFRDSERYVEEMKIYKEQTKDIKPSLLKKCKKANKKSANEAGTTSDNLTDTQKDSNSNEKETPKRKRGRPRMNKSNPVIYEDSDLEEVDLTEIVENDIKYSWDAKTGFVYSENGIKTLGKKKGEDSCIEFI